MARTTIHSGHCDAPRAPLQSGSTYIHRCRVHAAKAITSALPGATSPALPSAHCQAGSGVRCLSQSSSTVVPTCSLKSSTRRSLCSGSTRANTARLLLADTCCSVDSASNSAPAVVTPHTCWMVSRQERLPHVTKLAVVGQQMVHTKDAGCTNRKCRG